jgi:hypothetical protein
MKIKVIVHEAEEGGYWAEVPAIPGCATQGETFSLVPKLGLGTLYGAKLSLVFNVVPKCNLGTS